VVNFSSSLDIASKRKIALEVLSLVAMKSFRKRLTQVSQDKDDHREDDKNSESYASEWHAAIHSHNWESLGNQLTKHQWDKESRKSRKSLTYSKRSSRELSPSWDDLLVTDELGRTPLHLACQEDAPSTLVQKMVVLEKSALSMADNEGSYVIHMVTKNERCDPDVQKIIETYPRALLALDKKGKSALAYAIELAIGDTKLCKSKAVKDPVQFWGLKTCADQLEWQKYQIAAWAKVTHLLTRMMHHKKAVIPKQQGKLIEQAMQAGAPVIVVELLITCSRNHQQAKIFARRLALCAKVIYMVAGMSNWIEPRKDLVEAKGKGKQQTYWVSVAAPRNHGPTKVPSKRSSELMALGAVPGSDDWARLSAISIIIEHPTPEDAIRSKNEKLERLIDWNVEVLSRYVQNIMAIRSDDNSDESNDSLPRKISTEYGGGSLQDEVSKFMAVYNNKSVTEQNSVDTAWNLLMKPVV
jgi:hypothetical protein